MSALADITLAGIAPASSLFKASHVDRNQVGVLVYRPSATEVSAQPLTIQNQIVTNGATQKRNIKSKTKLSVPRVATDPILGEIPLDTGYGEAVFTFPVSWTTAQKEHVVKLLANALLNTTIINTMTGNDKPF